MTSDILSIELRLWLPPWTPFHEYQQFLTQMECATETETRRILWNVYKAVCKADNIEFLMFLPYISGWKPVTVPLEWNTHLYVSCPASPQPPLEGQVHQPFPGPTLLPADLSLSKDDTGFISHFTWNSVREGRGSFWLSFVFLSVHSQELCGCLPQRISDSDKQIFGNPPLIQSHSGNSPKVKESVMAMHLPSGILFPFTQP